MKTIPLSQGKVALVDDADYAWLNQWKWYADKNRKTFYARRNMRVGPYKQRAIKMHRVLTDAREDQLVDHRDGDGLNNQRYNLRVCDEAQSSQNRGLRKHCGLPFKGVRRSRWGKGYVAVVKANKRRIALYGFKTARDAALAYDAMALKYHGEFARTNAMLGLL